MPRDIWEFPADPLIGLCPKLLGEREARLVLPLLNAIPGPQHVPEPAAGWRPVPGSSSGLRGIMTLRNPKGVVLALFFFAVRGETVSARTLRVPRLRSAEPVGRHVVFGSLLRAVVGLGVRLDCREALVLAEDRSCAWRETLAGLLQEGPRHGFLPSGRNWRRPL